MAKRPLEDAEQVEVKSLATLHDWLAAHHTRDTGVWLIHYKKSSPHCIAMGDIVDECLCWGWIDGLVRAKDNQRTMHYIAPRNPASNWSTVNKDKIKRLDAAGRMRPAGQDMVRLAKECGTWTALDGVENGVIPPDLQAALDAGLLEEAWHALPRSVKRGALEILLNTKQARTRVHKIDTITQALNAGERPFQ